MTRLRANAYADLAVCLGSHCPHFSSSATSYANAPLSMEYVVCMSIYKLYIQYIYILNLGVIWWGFGGFIKASGVGVFWQYSNHFDEFKEHILRVLGLMVFKNKNAEPTSCAPTSIVLNIYKCSSQNLFVCSKTFRGTFCCTVGRCKHLIFCAAILVLYFTTTAGTGLGLDADTATVCCIL